MPGGRPVHGDVCGPVAVVVSVAQGDRPARPYVDGELVAHLPHAGRRMVDGKVRRAVAVVITGHRHVAPTAELRRELVAHVPVPRGRPVDRDVGQAIAVVVGGHRHVAGATEASGRQLVAHVPPAGRGAVDGDVGRAIPVVVRRNWHVTGLAEVRPELVAHVPEARWTAGTARCRSCRRRCSRRQPGHTRGRRSGPTQRSSTRIRLPAGRRQCRSCRHHRSRCHSPSGPSERQGWSSRSHDVAEHRAILFAGVRHRARERIGRGRGAGDVPPRAAAVGAHLPLHARPRRAAGHRHERRRPAGLHRVIRRMRRDERRRGLVHRGADAHDGHSPGSPKTMVN